jgi:UDP-glucose 4-epimerase
MKVFITGVAGFLGSHLADRMIALGHEVVGNDNLIGGYVDNVPQGVEFHAVDCCDLENMTNTIKDCDIVYHAAATAHEGLSVFSPNFITKNVFQATVSVISASIQNKVKKIVYCSSMARYGSQAHPFSESMNPAPVDPYGIAKVAGEDVLKNLCNLNGIEWNIAVPHNIVGPRQKYDDPFRNVMSIMINRCLQGKPPIIYGDGEQMRCFSYVDDCVYCLERLAFDGNIKKEIFNIGPDEESVTINELAKIIMEKTGFKGEVIYTPDRPKEVKCATCSSEKARNLLNYKTKTSLDEAVEQTMRYIKERGVKPFDYSYPLEIVNELTPITWKEKTI